MTDRIEPVLTPDEWQRISKDGDLLRIAFPSPGDAQHPDYRLTLREGDAARLIALANAALPESDPRKITREWVTGLRVRGYHADGGPDTRLLRIAAALESYLPPAP